jgi:hypothetical protein
MFLHTDNKTKWETEHDVFVTGSGKAAIALIFRYLKSVGALSSKTDGVLMSPWLGYWVYNQVNEFARPVFSLGPSVKVIMPYHQYGFPQNIQEINDYARSIGAVVVEDCAHALAVPTNVFEELDVNFRLYSFSKYFFCYTLGGVTGGGVPFKDFASRNAAQAQRWITSFNNIIKLFSEWHQSGLLPNFRLWNILLGMSYSTYGIGINHSPLALRLMRRKIDEEVDLRRKRYQYFRERFKVLEVERYLGNDDVAPYVIPLLLPLDNLKSILNDLLLAKYQTGIYHFDVNRNIINSKFEKVLWILLGSSLTDAQYEFQLDIIAKGLDKT